MKSFKQIIRFERVQMKTHDQLIIRESSSIDLEVHMQEGKMKKKAFARLQSTVILYE